MNMKHTLLASGLVIALGVTGLAAPSAHAAIATSTMPVTITIQNACDVSSVAPTSLDFGTQGLLATAVNNTSTLTVTCTSGAAYNIGLDGGGSGNINARVMNNGGNTIGYQLYSDSGRTTVWGNTIGTDTLASTGTGSAQSFTVYGQVPAQATPPAGVYNDTVNVTVTY
ncbi:MAG TPA: spore coat U domain-containing protein [Rhodanobacteraceae bacterium]|nr:spore coat U domain-containing protein [Rhodanobacteraceae bacterium]